VLIKSEPNVSAIEYWLSKLDGFSNFFELKLLDSDKIGKELDFVADESIFIFDASIDEKTETGKNGKSKIIKKCLFKDTQVPIHVNFRKYSKLGYKNFSFYCLMYLHCKSCFMEYQVTLPRHWLIGLEGWKEEYKEFEATLHRVKFPLNQSKNPSKDFKGDKVCYTTALYLVTIKDILGRYKGKTFLKRLLAHIDRAIESREPNKYMDAAFSRVIAPPTSSTPLRSR